MDGSEQRACTGQKIQNSVIIRAFVCLFRRKKIGSIWFRNVDNRTIKNFYLPFMDFDFLTSARPSAELAYDSVLIKNEFIKKLEVSMIMMHAVPSSTSAQEDFYKIFSMDKTKIERSLLE